MGCTDQQFGTPTLEDTQRLCEQLQDVVFSTGLNLNTEEAQELEESITKFQDIFTTKSDDYGWTDRIYHPNNTSNACPID
jgi:hypothetical protein